MGLGARRSSSLIRGTGWLLLLMLLPGESLPLTPAGTVIPHSFQASYGAPLSRAVSNQTTVTVKGLTDPTIAPPRSAFSPSGTPVDFLHTITNRGNATDRFSLRVVSVRQQGSGDTSSCTMRFYAADGKTALTDGDGDGFPETAAIAAGGTLDLILRVTPAPGSEGVVDTFTVTAASVQIPAATTAVSDQLTVLRGEGWGAPVKSVSPAGGVLPGALLTYTISFANNNAIPVNGVLIADTLDGRLDFQPGSASVPVELPGAAATYDAPSRKVSFHIPTVPAGFAGAVSFRGTVRTDTPGNTEVANLATMASELAPAPVASNRTVTPVLAQMLRINKTSTTLGGEAGDIIPYAVKVENVGLVPLSHVTVTDLLPRGFRYLRGSSLLDGSTIADPQSAGRQLSWDIGTVEVGGARLLSYRAVITADAPAGNSANWARAGGTTPAGNPAAASPASAVVKVRRSILGDRAIILGRVFVDRNGNGVPDQGEAGVPAVRLYLEDGSYVITDEEGQYSFTGLSPGVHVVKIDSATLAPRYAPIPYNTAFAGVGWSQFVTVPFGGPARGDFALEEGGEGPIPTLSLPWKGRGPEGSASSMGNGTEPAAVETPPLVSAPLMPQPEPQRPWPVWQPLTAEPPPRVPVHFLPPRGAEVATGPAARLVLSPDRVEIPADGKTAVPFTVQLLTGDGRRVAGERLVTVFCSKGVIAETDADPALPGHQLRVEDGSALFHLRSTLVTGQDEMVLTAGAPLSALADLFFTPELRDWIVVGLGTFTVGGRGVSGHIEADERPETGIYHDERLAFFSKGKILGKYLLTAAYDSDKERPDGVFQQIDPEKYYPVYGDAGDIGYEAQSNSRFFVKLEAGRSSALVGDYRTDLSENEFSRYDRALNGAKVVLDGKYLGAAGFESKAAESSTRDEFRGNGTSGYFFLTARPVLENSERVRIEVRDRYHSERVLSTVQKVRYADYSIDYNTGAILFKEPVPSLDRELNPVTVVVVYQGVNGGEERYVYGGRGVVKGANGSLLGATAVVEQGSVQDNTLLGVDGALKIGGRLSLRGEGAFSDTAEKGRGDAFKVELLTRPVDALDLSAYYRKVDRDFVNSSMTGKEIGTEKYGGLADYRLGNTRLRGESFVQKDLLGTSLFGNDLTVLSRFGLLHAEGGFKRIEKEKEGAKGDSDILYAGVHAPVTARLDATVRREQLLFPSPVKEYQTKTQLKLDYRLTDSTHAFLTEEYQEGSPDLRQSTLLGMESRLSERMRLSAGYQLQQGALGAGDHANVDLNSVLYREGAFTVGSRTGYQLEHALSQERGQAILGLNGRFEPVRGTFVNSTLERVETVQGAGGTGTAFTLAGEYLRERAFKATGRYEIKDGGGETSSLYGAALAYKATPSVTLLAKGTLWEKEAPLGEDRIIDGYLGGAWRPLYGNPLQLLTLARYKGEDKGSLPGVGKVQSLTLSAEPTYRLHRRWSAQGKYAGKISWQSAAGHDFEAYSDLFLAGVAYDLAEKIELSLYVKLMNQYDAGVHSFGAVGSAGYRVYRDVVLLAGYNYARVDDRDLTGESFEGQGPFVGVKVKFDEQMFETGERRAKAVPLPLPLPPAAAPPAPAVVAAAPPTVRGAPRRVLAFTGAGEDQPLEISGSAELFTLVINGEPARLPSTAVTLGREKLSGSVEVKNGKLLKPVTFRVSLERPEEVAGYRFTIRNNSGEAVHTVEGVGAPASGITWHGETKRGALVKGEVYQYQLEMDYKDGSSFASARYLFGVNRREAVLLTLSGGAFIFDSSRLTAEAKDLLKKAARVIRAHPQEKVIVEGHTDGIGTARYNMGLSKRRCDAAADYLMSVQAIPASRLVRRWYGKSRPIADNASSEGRRVNRRVELKGDFEETVPVEPNDRYRTKAYVIINGREVEVDTEGRFATTEPAQVGTLKVEMGDSQGRSMKTVLPVPALWFAEPTGEAEVAFGASAAGYRVEGRGNAACTLSGRTDPGTVMEVDGRPVAVDGLGAFSVELPLKEGENVFGVVLRNRAGCSRFGNFRVRFAPREPAVEGRLTP